MCALLSIECSTIKTTLLLHVGRFPALNGFQNRCEPFAPLLAKDIRSSLLMMQKQSPQSPKLPRPHRSGVVARRPTQPQMFPHFQNGHKVDT